MQPEITEQDRATAAEARQRAAERFAVREEIGKELKKGKNKFVLRRFKKKIGTKENVPGAFGRDTARMINTRAGHTLIELVIMFSTILTGLAAMGLVGALAYWLVKNT